MIFLFMVLVYFHALLAFIRKLAAKIYGINFPLKLNLIGEKMSGLPEEYRMQQVRDLTDPRLTIIIDELRVIRKDMKDSSDIKSHVMIEHIANASLQQCTFIVDILVDRVVELVGCARELEDARSMLLIEIDSEAKNA